MPINIGNSPFLRRFDADQLYVSVSGGSDIICASGNRTGLYIQGSPTQVSSLLRLADSTGRTVFSVNASGIISNAFWQGEIIST